MIEKTVKDFTIASASRDPVPGGGGVSALCGSLAASLSEMVTNLTIGKKRYAEFEEELRSIKNEADSLRERLLDCIKEDADAFAPLAKAYSLPKDTQGYAEKMEACLKAAAQPPFHILMLLCEVVKMDERLSVIGSKLAVSDAATSAVLSYGAMQGAYINIIVNTRLMKDREYAENLNKEAKTLLKEYSSRALTVYQEILEKLNG